MTAFCSPEQLLPAVSCLFGSVAHVPPTFATPTAAVEVESTLISSVVFAAELDPLPEDEPDPELLFDELPPD